MNSTRGPNHARRTLAGPTRFPCPQRSPQSSRAGATATADTWTPPPAGDTSRQAELGTPGVTPPQAQPRGRRDGVPTSVPPTPSGPTEAPAAPQERARRLEIRDYTIRVRDQHRRESPVRITDLICTLRDLFIAAHPGGTLTATTIGGAAKYIHGMRATRPSDRDDRLVLHGVAMPSTFEDMRALVVPLLEEALQRLVGAPVPFITFPRYDADGHMMLCARIGLPGAHMDLKFLPHGSPFRDYDYTTAPEVPLPYLLDVDTPLPYLTASSVPAEVQRQNHARGWLDMDHALVGDSVLREWKERVRYGFVPKVPRQDVDPARLAHFEALLPTSLRHLRDEGAAQGSVGYATCELIKRARGMVLGRVDPRVFAVHGDDPASPQALALVAVAILSLHHGRQHEGAPALLAAFRNNVQRYLDASGVQGPARHLMALLRDEPSLEAAVLWLHLLADPDQPFDPNRPPSTYGVGRAETPGGDWLRLWFPELTAYVSAPDRPDAAR
ncbi:MAG TPA: hypothetical protein VFH51_18125, partial [Myxococcota bacterium]|nr:hypothetical protein [Myxococcota bacterium]